MEIFLFAVIVLQFAYMVYSDIKNREEREALELKIMSEGISEYKKFTEEEQSSPKQEEDPYISVEEASIERILAAKEK